MDSSYLEHYLDWQNAGLFFIVSLVGLVVILSLLFAYARAHENKNSGSDTDAHLGGRKGSSISGSTCRIIESFYELVFSSTSILFFLAAYYLIDRFLKDPTYRVPWDKYSDVILMAFIFMSIFLNLFFDKVLVRLKWITSDDKASIRLVSTIYMVLIFLYIRFIYDDLNYNELIVYFLGLVIGRFVYFDFTWIDFSKTMKGIWHNMPLLLLMLIYSGIMCFVGFKSKFLLTSNGVIVSILIAHIFMDISILIAHIILRPMTEKPPRTQKIRDAQKKNDAKSDYTYSRKSAARVHNYKHENQDFDSIDDNISRGDDRDHYNDMNHDNDRYHDDDRFHNNYRHHYDNRSHNDGRYNDDDGSRDDEDNW